MTKKVSRNINGLRVIFSGVVQIRPMVCYRRGFSTVCWPLDPGRLPPFDPSPNAGHEGNSKARMMLVWQLFGSYANAVKLRRNGRRKTSGKKSRVIVGNDKYCFFRANFLFLYRPPSRGKIRTSGSHETWYFLRLSASRHDNDDDDKTVNRRPTGEIGTYCHERAQRRPTVVWSPRRSPITELVSADR